jgi:hypothetical protein
MLVAGAPRRARRSDGSAQVRMKAPNTKLQIPRKLQISSSNTLPGRRSLEFGAWDFSGAWCLGFGASCAQLLKSSDFAAAPSRACPRSLYVFSARSAAVLGSSNVSTPDTRELYQISIASKPAAPEDGRTPLSTYRSPARFPHAVARRHFKARDQESVHNHQQPTTDK